MNWSKKTLKMSTLVCAAALFSFMAGCGDSSSSPSQAGTDASASSDAPGSSASVDNPESAASPENPGSSASEKTPSTPATPQACPDAMQDPLIQFNRDPANAGISVTPDADGFYDMGDVYKAVPATDKIAFVIRHSKRQKSLGKESELTPIGVQMAQTLGSKLVSDESFYYTSTDFVRTRETCSNIAIGRGETNAEVVTWDGINGGYFLTVPSDTLDALVSSKGGNQKYIAQYAYDELFVPVSIEEQLLSYFQDFYPRGNQFVKEVILANMPSWKRVSILVSHDMLVEPLIVFVSNRTIDLKIYQPDYRWVNYLSGIAVISNDAGCVTVLPVRGDSVGWMINGQEVDESVQ